VLRTRSYTRRSGHVNRNPCGGFAYRASVAEPTSTLWKARLSPTSQTHSAISDREIRKNVMKKEESS